MIKLKHILCEITIKDRSIRDQIIDYFNIDSNHRVISHPRYFKKAITFRIPDYVMHHYQNTLSELAHNRFAGVSLTYSDFNLGYTALTINEEFDMNNIDVPIRQGSKTTLADLIWMMIDRYSFGND